MSNDSGRPPAEAPSGYVTIQQAVERTGVSYATVYRHVQRGQVRSQQAPNGVIAIHRDDVKLIKIPKRERADKPSVTIRFNDPDRLARWELVAGDRSVQTWLSELADKAVERAERAAK